MCLRLHPQMVRAVREATVRMDMERRGLDPAGPLPAKDEEMGLCVSLSAGELPKEVYQRWYNAGARRYLLRIESSNPDLYAMLHPSAMSWQHRVDCLKALKEVRGRRERAGVKGGEAVSLQ